MAVEVDAVQSALLGVGGSLPTQFHHLSDFAVREAATGDGAHVEVGVPGGGDGQFVVVEEAWGLPTRPSPAVS